MDLSYPPEAESFRGEIRIWLEANLPDGWFEPGFRQSAHERTAWLQDWNRRLVEGGWLCATWPREYGGRGLTTMQGVVLAEEFNRVSAPMRGDFFGDTLVGPTILQWGSEAQKQHFIPLILRGAIAWCQGFSEPDSGSDLASLRATAVADGDEWVINGQKIFITNGSVADFAVITAKTDPEKGTRGISAFIVEKGTPGFQPGRDEKKMGLKGSVTSELFFEDCRIPAENLLGKENEGFRQFLVTLDAGRVAIAAMAVGLAQGAFERATAYAKERVQFGQPIAEFQAIQWMIAEMATEIEAARLMVHRAAWLKEQGARFTKEAAMAKLLATETSERVCRKAIQVHGGYGYMREYAVERMYRDQRLCSIGEGTNEIQRLVIARQVLGR